MHTHDDDPKHVVVLATAEAHEATHWAKVPTMPAAAPVFATHKVVVLALPVVATALEEAGADDEAQTEYFVKV